MVAKFYYPAGIALENENHSTPDLGGRHCHIGIPELGSKAYDRARQCAASASIGTERKRKQPRNLAAFRTSVKLRHYRLERLPQVVRDDPLAGKVRVHSVRLVEAGDAGDTIE